MIFLSGTGTSPISSWAFVMDKNTELSAGTYTFIINMVMIVGQIAIMHKHGLRGEMWNILLQVPFSAIFGMFIDSSRYMLQTGMAELGITVLPYWGSLLMLAAGIVIQSFGVFLEIRPQVTMMSAEAFVNYSCVRWKWEFGNMKVFFDCGLVLLAVLCGIGFSIWHTTSAGAAITLQTFIDGILDGVREGTVLSALLVGRLVTLFKYRIGERLDTILTTDPPVPADD